MIPDHRTGARASRRRSPGRRRGLSLMWVVAALALATAMTPLYVSLCHSLAALSRRNAHRLTACQRGSAELERLQGMRSPADRSFPVPELPGGKGEVEVGPGPSGSLAQVRLTVAWREGDAPARAQWVTLVRRQP